MPRLCYKCKSWIYWTLLIFKNFIYLLLAVLHGLFWSCGGQGLSSGCCAKASRCDGLSCCGTWSLEHRLSNCGTPASLLPGMWDLQGSGIEPESPALAGEFFTTEPPTREALECLLSEDHGPSNMTTTLMHLLLPQILGGGCHYHCPTLEDEKEV